MTETEQTVALAIKAAKERDIHHIVVASTHGDTLELLKDCGLHVVGVTTAYDKGVCGLSEEKRKVFEAMGMDIVTAGHALSGAERSFSRKYGGYGLTEIVADTLRMFGQGTKVCVEISTMALDAGKIPYQEKVLAIAGNGSGANTALVLTPASSNALLDTKIHEILCKDL